MNRFALALLPLLVACGDKGDPSDTAEDSIVPTFFSYLRGTFDSSEQAAADPTYYDITLQMCPASVPDLGEYVLYVEQSVTGSNPYRQRLYVLSPGDPPDTSAVSSIYEFNDPDPFIGFCGTGSTEGITVDAAYLLEGCDVTVTWDGQAFTGGTGNGTCLTDYNGATYTTSEVTLDAEKLTSWDRGYNDADEQVWGAVDGPYIFVRQTALEE